MGNHDSYSDIFGFRILFRWRPFDFAQDMLGEISFVKVILLNI
jgi:hypothetical protein